MSLPKKNVAYEFDISLVDSSTGRLRINPTIVEGDFKVSINNGALANLATLPVVSPAGSTIVKVNLSVGEMGGDKIMVQGIDAADDEWGDVMTFIDATRITVDDLLPARGVALSNIPFLFVAASDHVTPVTGATGLAVTRLIDNGSWGAGTGSFAEAGNGLYRYSSSAADVDGGKITFRFTASGGTPGAPDDRFVTIITGAGM